MNNPVLSSSSSSSSSFESLSTASDLEDPFPIYPSSSSSCSNNSRRKGSNWAMMPPTNSPRFSSDDDERDHFLDSCFLCTKPLGGGRDIYMYRGDTPFCSEECRQEQIEMDEAKEKRLKMSTRAKEKKSTKSQKIHVRAASTVVAG